MISMLPLDLLQRYKTTAKKLLLGPFPFAEPKFKSQEGMTLEGGGTTYRAVSF